jgi:hypothetical protein
VIEAAPVEQAGERVALSLVAQLLLGGLLADVARLEVADYGMWTLTEPDNAAARALYERADGSREDGAMFVWESERDRARSGGARCSRDPFPLTPRR